MADMFGQGADYSFSIVDSTVWPRSVYPKLRRFVTDAVHGQGGFDSLWEAAASPSGGMRPSWSECVYTDRKSVV